MSDKKQITLTLPIIIRPTINNDGYVIVDKEENEFFFYEKEKGSNEMQYDGCCVSIKDKSLKTK